MKQGIVTVIKNAAGNEIHETWRELETKFGYSFVQNSLAPHFSWHVADGYPYQLTKSRLTGLADHTISFEARAVGIGLFPGEQPVIYIPVIVSAELRKLYELVYQIAVSVCENEVVFYQPHRWMPHISLALNDTDISQSGKVVQFLMRKTNSFTFMVDNFGLFCPDEDGVNTICEIPFRGQSS